MGLADEYIEIAQTVRNTFLRLGDTPDSYAGEAGSGLLNQLQVAIQRTMGAALDDNYTIELDVEVDP